jgi:hypothetical protein
MVRRFVHLEIPYFAVQSTVKTWDAPGTVFAGYPAGRISG